MNNSRKITPIVVFIALLSIGLSASNAQDQTGTPTPPYVAAVPDFCQWTMTITATPKKTDRANPPATATPDEGAKALAKPITVVKVASTKTKDIKRDIVYYSNGNHSEVWYYRNYAILRSPNGEFQFFQAGSSDASLFIPDVSGVGFIGTDWITVQNFQAIKKLENGQQVYVYGGISKFKPLPAPPSFDQNGNAVPSPPPPEIEIPMKAMIAVDSRLPFVVEKDAWTYTYSYEPRPTEMLELPADIQKRFSSMEAAESFDDKLRALSRH
jgi:hypothetical protein